MTPPRQLRSGNLETFSYASSWSGSGNSLDAFYFKVSFVFYFSFVS